MFTSTQIAFFIFGSGSMPEAPVTVSGARISYGGRDQSTNETGRYCQARPYGSSSAWTTYATLPAITSTQAGYDTGAGTVFNSGLIAGHPYNADLECRVVDFNGIGASAAYTPIRFRTMPEFGITTLTVAATTSTSATVSFTPPAPAPLTGYRGYYRVVGTTPWILGSTVAAGATAFTFSGLISSTTYQFKGAAYNVNDGAIPDQETELNATSATATTNGISLIAHWKLDETSGTALNDQTASHFVGTLVGSTYTLAQSSLFASEPSGKSIAFEGIYGAHGNMGNPTALQLTGDFTISCWYKPITMPVSGSYHVLASKGYDSTNEGASLRLAGVGGGTTTSLEVNSYATAGNALHGTTFAMTWPLGVAKYITAGYGEGAWHLCVNGVEVATTADVVGALASASNFCIAGEFLAAANGSFGRGCHGTLDDVKVYDGWIGQAAAFAAYTAYNTAP